MGGYGMGGFGGYGMGGYGMGKGMKMGKGMGYY